MNTLPQVRFQAVAQLEGVGGHSGQLALEDGLVRCKGAGTVAPIDLGAATSQQAPAGPVGGDRDDALADPLLPGAGVHAQSAANGARRAHGELEAAEVAAEGVLHHRGERGPRADHEAAVLEARGAKVAAEGDDHTGEALVGHEHVGAAAEHDPGHGLIGTHVDEAREGPDGVHPHEEAGRTPDAIGGVAAHGLVGIDVAVESVVHEQRLER